MDVFNDYTFSRQQSAFHQHELTIGLFCGQLHVIRIDAKIEGFTLTLI
jgi:hypothetical protein